MLKVIYDDNNGIVVSDAKIPQYVADHIAIANELNGGGELIITIGSELIFTAFRLAVYKKEISLDNIKFYYLDTEIPVNADGRLCSPDMPDHMGDILSGFFDYVFKD